MPSTRSLRGSVRSPLRLAALVGSLVAFDAVFVALTYWFGHLTVGAYATAMDWEVTGLLANALRFQTLPSVELVAVGTLVTLVVQSAFGYRQSAQTLPGAGDDADDERSSGDAPDREVVEARIADRQALETRLEERTTALAHVADMAPPEVRLIDDETPNSFVIGRPGERLLVATTALVETLDDDDELDAVLAHELSHLKNGDAFVMTAASFLPTVTRRVNDSVVDYFRILHPRVETEQGWKSAWANYYATITMLIVGPVALAASSALYVASGACYRLLSRIREFRADEAAAAICGSPAALAGALETLSRPQSRPSTDLRARTGVRELCILPHAIGGDDDEGRDDVVARARRRCQRLLGRALPSSHPPVERRVERLRERERDRRS